MIMDRINFTDEQIEEAYKFHFNDYCIAIASIMRLKFDLDMDDNTYDSLIRSARAKYLSDHPNEDNRDTELMMNQVIYDEYTRYWR